MTANDAFDLDMQRVTRRVAGQMVASPTDKPNQGSRSLLLSE